MGLLVPYPLAGRGQKGMSATTFKNQSKCRQLPNRRSAWVQVSCCRQFLLAGALERVSALLELAVQSGACLSS